MASNGKAAVWDTEAIEPLPVEIQESKEQLDAILDADFDLPIKDKLRGPYVANNPPLHYYKTIQPQLSQWWQEWCEALDERNGGPKYKTVAQLAKAKTKNPQQQRWLEAMIGPAPIVSQYKGGPRNKGQWLVVPWLGDWKQRRSNGWWAPEQPKKITGLVKCLKDKLQGLEAVQASAPYLVQEMATYQRLSEQVDQVFAGQALDLNKGITEENKSRFYTYLEMKKAVTRIKLRLLHEWWLAHGVSTDGQPVAITQVNALFQNAGMPAGIADSMPIKDLEALKLARMLQMHSDNFNMPLPSEDQPQVKKPEKPVIKGNGKVM